MTSRNAAWTLALALVLIVLSLGCSRVPRDHWWQLWRPKADSDVVHLDEEIIPGPPEVQPYDLADASTWGNLDPDLLAINPDETLIGLPEPEPIRQDPEGIIIDLATIYFEFDSFQLTPEGRAALEADADWIAARPDLTIRIEGHCDERGTEEYNYNLGQKRAQAVREFLVLRGIAEDRLHTWSWGELRPIDPASNEEAWRQNRRVQFAVWSVD